MNAKRRLLTSDDNEIEHGMDRSVACCYTNAYIKTLRVLSRREPKYWKTSFRIAPSRKCRMTSSAASTMLREFMNHAITNKLTQAQRYP